MTQSLKLNPGQCVICGSISCFQAIDHQKITFDELHRIVFESKQINSGVDDIKKKLDQFYNKLENRIVMVIRNDRLTTFKWLNKFYFSNLDDKKINVNEICQILQIKESKMISKKSFNVIKQLSKINRRNQPRQTNFQAFSQDFNDYIKQFNLKSLTSQIASQLISNKVLKMSLPLFLQSKKSISSISTTQLIQQAKQYKWKNVIINTKVKSLKLSNKQIKDQEFILQVPKLSVYTNVSQLEIRNNHITDISCRFIGNNFNYIYNLDIRGNKVGDDGLIYIIKSIAHLKSLMISQTNATNLTGYEIVNGLPNLEMLSAQYTKIVDECALRVGMKSSLKVLCLKGNQILGQYIEKLRKIFNPKGYVGL